MVLTLMCALRPGWYSVSPWPIVMVIHCPDVVAGAGRVVEMRDGMIETVS